MHTDEHRENRSNRCSSVFICGSILVLINAPAEVLAAGFREHLGRVTRIHRHVMFETVVADVVQKFLEFWYAGDGAVAEGCKLVVGGGALSDVAANDAGGVIGGESCVGQ